MASDDLAANLKRVRGARGMSQDRLAALAGLSRSAYRNIEGGAVEPRVRNLEAIARGLEVPVGELVQPARELRHVRFRSRKKLRTRGQILSDVGRWLDDDSALEELIGARRVFRLQGVAGETVAGQDRAVRAARIARATLGLTADEPVRDICGLLDLAGVKVFPKPVASDGFFGLSVGPAEGWGNIWARFRADDERAMGRSLCGSVEPLALAATEFDSGAPEVLRVREPDHLSAGDFRDDRLSGLVRRAIEAEEISLGRGAEVLGLSLEDMRALSAS